VTGPPLLVPRHVCRSCGRPFSPTHDASAPGPNVRHPYVEEYPDQPAKVEPEQPTEEELLDERLAAHQVETGETPAGLGYARCACGQWEAVVTGPASARWAFADYSAHLRRVLGTDPGA
jgi:hypothetical protein